MEVLFDNKHLTALYEKGKSRKYRLQPKVLKKFIMRIQQIEAAHTIHDLWKTPSLYFKKMKGHKPPYSVRVDREWRLEFEVEWSNKEQTKGIIIIKKLSKHYGD